MVIACDSQHRVVPGPCCGVFWGRSGETFAAMVLRSLGCGWTTTAGRHYCDAHPHASKRRNEVADRYALIRRTMADVKGCGYNGTDIYGDVAERCGVSRATVGRALSIGDLHG